MCMICLPDIWLSGFLECLLSNTERQELLKKEQFLYYRSMFNVKMFFLKMENRDGRTADKPSRCRGGDG